MVFLGANLSLCAADLHAATALLDRAIGAFVISHRLSFIPLASPAGRERRPRQARHLPKTLARRPIIALAVFGLAAFASQHGYELPWVGRDKLSDQTYMRHMRTHHEQGIELASIAAEHAADPHLRALARLM